MASRLLFFGVHRLTVARPSLLRHLSSRATSIPLLPSRMHTTPPIWQRRRCGWCQNYSHGAVTLVLREGQPRFETREIEPPKKEKWLSKKRLKMKRKSEKRKRKEANVNDPRRIRPKGSKNNPRFLNAEARLSYKIEKAKLKEALLVEKLKKYEVPKLHGPTVKPDILSGEERFYMKKLAQKKSNYVPVGRRGVFSGVILNMHLHWKKHETVKVICKPCKPDQIHEYAGEIARLSGGTPIQIIGDDTIIFYRGKNYVQPEVMSPIDTLSKKKALEKSKYEQSLESVRHFIAVSEKELELYHRHVSLYCDQNSKDSDSAIVERKEMLESGSGTLQCVVEEGSQHNGNGFHVNRKILGRHSDSGGKSSTETESFCGLQSDTETYSDAEEEESIISVTDGFYTDLSDTVFDSEEEVEEFGRDAEMENKTGDECISNIRKYQQLHKPHNTGQNDATFDI